MLKVKGAVIGKVLFFAILIFPFCITTTFNYVLPGLYVYARPLRAFMCLVVMYLYIVFIRDLKRQWLLLLLVTGYMGVLFYSTVVNHVSLYYFAVNYAVTVVFFVFLFEIAVHKYLAEILEAVWLVCFLLTAANLVSILMYPKGLYQRYDLFSSGIGVPYWLLGNRNLYIDFLLPLMVASIFLIYIKGIRPVRFYFSITIAGLTVALTGSATSTMVILLMLLYWIFMPKKTCPRWFDAVNFLFAYAFSTIAVVVMGKTDIFRPIIVSVLKRDLTLSSRTRIWNLVIDAIGQSPVIGYGYRSGTNFISTSKVMHAHNLFLHVLYSGGVIAFLLLCSLLAGAAIHLHKNRHSPLASFLTMVFIAYLCIEFSEPRIYFPFLFAVIVLLWNIPLIEKQCLNLGIQKSHIKIRWMKFHG